MKAKLNNNLVKLTFNDGTFHYYTSENRAGYAIGKQVYNINRSIATGIEIIIELGKTCKVEIVDGSEVPYKYIN